MNSRNDFSLRAVPTARDPQRNLRFLTAGACGVLLSGCAAALITNDTADWLAVGGFAGLFVAAENRDRVFSDETGLSGSIAVALAASVFFAIDGWLLGAFLSCATGGLYLAHLRQRSVMKIALNAACFGLSAFGAAALVSVLRDASGATAMLAIAAVAATLAYWTLNSCLLGVAISVVTGRSLITEVGTLIRSDTVMLFFGFGGALCGIVMVEVGVWVGFGALVALLVALDVFVISVPAGLTELRSAWAMVVTRGVSGGVAGTVSAIVTRAVSVSVLGAFAGLAAGVFAGCAVVAGVVAARLYMKYRHVYAATVGGIVLVEMVVPVIAAVSGAVAVLVSVEAAFVVASVLVIGASVVVAVRRRHAAATPRVVDEDVLMAAVVEALAEELPARER